MREIVICGIGYFVTVADWQVIFEESRPVFGCFTQFIFERPRDINNSNGIWYLVDMKTSYPGGIVAGHLRDALKWCEDEFGKSFEDYKGELALK